MWVNTVPTNFIWNIFFCAENWKDVDSSEATHKNLKYYKTTLQILYEIYFCVVKIKNMLTAQFSEVTHKNLKYYKTTLSQKFCKKLHHWLIYKQTCITVINLHVLVFSLYSLKSLTQPHHETFSMLNVPPADFYQNEAKLFNTANISTS